MTDQETHAFVVAKFTDKAIEDHIRALRDFRLSGIKGTWHNFRLTALRAEMAKRDQAERSKP